MMNRRHFQIYPILITALCLLGLQSCRNGGRSSSAQHSGNGIKYVKALYSFPTTFDPSQMNDLYSVSVGNLIYSGLLEFTENLEIRGDLAESFKTSRDGTLISITLRKNVKFHDGTVVRAPHVIRSIMRLLGKKSLVYTYYNCIAGAEEYHTQKASKVSGLIARSDREIEIRLKYPFPPFLSVLAGVTAKILKVDDFFDEKTYFKHPIGSGPFKISKLDFGILELERNDGYYGQLPKISTLAFDFSPLKVATEKAHRGEIHDMVSAPMVGTENVFSWGQHIQAPLSETWIIGLNTRLEPFNDVSIRRGFRAAVPTEEFRKQLHPLSQQAFGYVPPGLPGHLGENNKRQAEEIMYSAPKKISKTPITVAFPMGLHRGREMQAFLTRVFQASGWNVKIEEMAWEPMWNGVVNKKWQAFLITMNMDYPDPEFLFRNFDSQSADNFSGLNDPLMDKLVRQARKLNDRIAREKIYQRLSLRLLELAPVVHMLHPKGHYWLHPCVRDYKPNILSHVYTDYRTIDLDEKCLKDPSLRSAK